MDSNTFNDEKSERRLYIGNLDLRITEAALIKIFSPFGKIISEDFLWHTHGPKRGEPRGYAFVQYSTKEEAICAKEKMHGRMACGRPLVVRLASEKCGLPTCSKSIEERVPIQSVDSVSRRAKIAAAIKNKLKAMDEEECRKNSKRPKHADKPCADS